VNHFRGKKGPIDALGSGENTQSHRINLAMTSSFQTLEEIAEKANVRVRRAEDHMRFLAGEKEEKWKGYPLVERNGKRWALNQDGLAKLGASGTTSTAEEGYSPDGIDRRKMVERPICERPGQGKFKDDLLERYRNRCAVTGCEIGAILEAAHISPYLGEDDNDPSNGLLLRADIHTLFDRYLLGVEPESLCVVLHSSIVGEYGQFGGQPLRCPGDKPSRQALRARFRLFGQAGR
jgi:hypothetical protein